MIRLKLAFLSVLTVFTTAPQALAQGTPPAAGVIYGEPDIAGPTLSPSGNRLAYIRHEGDERDGRATVVLLDLTGPEPEVFRTLPFDRKVKWVQWASEDRILVSLSATRPIRGGWAWFVTSGGQIVITDELDVSFIAAMDTDGSDPVVLFASNRSLGTSQLQLDYVVDFLADDPDHVLMGVRGRRRAGLDVYRANVHNGRASRIDRGRPETLAWFTDSRGVTVMRLDAIPYRQEVAVLIREEDGELWTRVAQNSISSFSELAEGVNWVGRTDTINEALVTAENEETGRRSLFRFDFFTGDLAAPIWTHPLYDIAGVQVDPVSGRALALTWADERTHVEVFDPELAAHWPALESFFGDEVVVRPMQRAGDRVLVQISGPVEPASYFVYSLSRTQVDALGPRIEQLNNAALATVRIHHYQAADGTDLFGYLTIPPYPAATPTPLVVLPHGGPKARDYYGFDTLAQLIAAEGFMVFQPQYRGSAGFGREFAEAGYGQWAGLIQSDITDGVRSVIASKQVDADRVCVAGWSFGGYSALLQAILEPDLYRCAAAGAAVTDPESLLAHAEADLEGEAVALRAMIGATDEAALARLSAVGRVNEITVPVLLVHGREDRIVPVEQSEMMAEALEAADADYDTFYFDGGHSLDNRRDMQRAMFQITRFLTLHIDPR